MVFLSKTIRLKTNSRVELINITSLIEYAVRESGVKGGLCVAHVPHATAALILNEDEPNLRSDIIKLIKALTENEWMHNRIDDNAEAHLAGVILGSTVVLPIVNGRLARGTWQEIMLVELDGPRSERRVVVTILGE